MRACASVVVLLVPPREWGPFLITVVRTRVFCGSLLFLFGSHSTLTWVGAL